MEVCRKTTIFAPSNIKKLHDMDKIKVSQDELKTFLEAHDFVRVAIAKKMGVSESMVGNCFTHALNRHGKPMSFTKRNIGLLNQALQQIAEELSTCKLKCSNEEAATRRFINDDPAIIESLSRISEYIKLRGFTYKVLGWTSRRTCENNINLKEPNPRVHLKKEEIELINTEILAIASTLAGWEVVVDKDSDSE